MNSASNLASVPRSDDLEAIAQLRADLSDSAYTVDTLADLFGSVAAGALQREQLVPALVVTEGTDHPAATLARLFMLGATVRVQDLDRALPRTATAGAVALGLVAATRTPGEVRALMDLRPCEGSDAAGDFAWWIASDLGETETRRGLRTDHVLGVGGASLTLARVTLREQVGRVLDLGTGCGIQALLAARHADHVIATDISPRALAFAQFNARLAGLDIEFRRGSMLEPVAGEVFDLVVTNPPFVITPRSEAMPEFEYRDGGLAGDDLVAALIAQLPDVLAPGGVAQLLANWEIRGTDPWHRRVSSWLEGSSADAWVIQRDVLDPAFYAETWLRDGGQSPQRGWAEWEAGYRAWLADFAARDVTAVGFGIVTIQVPDEHSPAEHTPAEHTPAEHTPAEQPPSTRMIDKPWRRFEDYREPVADGLAEAISASLQTVNWLASIDSAALRASHLHVSPQVTEERSYVPGSADPSAIVLRQAGGWQRTVPVSSLTAATVGACDGELSIGQILEALAALTGQPARDVEQEVLPAVRDLLIDGLCTAPGSDMRLLPGETS